VIVCLQPYWGGESDYGPDLFSRDEYAASAHALAALQGRFFMTLNDVPAVCRANRHKLLVANCLRDRA
jgi:hypothetical protein